MNFLNLLQNTHLQQAQRPVVQRPSSQQPTKPVQKAHSAPQSEQPKPVADTYKVKSSTGKEFTRRRKQASADYRSMQDNDLLKAYDDALDSGDTKKRKRVLYYVRTRGLKVRQLRRKLNGSE
jgi:hypothetical protein